MENDGRDWLTVAAAARFLNLSDWSIYQACAAGELRHVRIGGRRAIRLTRAAIDEWLLQHEREPLADRLINDARPLSRRATAPIAAEVPAQPNAFTKKGAV